MAINWRRFVQKTHFIEADEPSDHQVVVGTLWSDADNGDLYICTSVSPIVFTSVGTGAGASANASYVVMALDASLTNERVLTAGFGISITDNGPQDTVVIEATGTAAASFWPSLMLGGM